MTSLTHDGLPTGPADGTPSGGRADPGPPRRGRRPLARFGRGVTAAARWSAMQAVLTTAAVSLGVCVTVWFYATAVRPSSSDRLLLTAILMAPAVIFAAGRSTLLLDYFLVLVVTNRELRRLLDWGEGHYDPTPVLSLLPLLATFLMVPAVLANWRRLPGAMRLAAVPLVAAMAYGTAVGVVGYGLGAVYTCAEYVTPLIVLYFAVACRPTAQVLQRWVVVLGTLGVLAGAYGIYQWTSLPPWDAAWLIWSGMSSSMGGARAFQMSICSTLESRGPAAIFFAITTAMFIALPVLRRRGGVLLAAVPAIALLLTQARTGVVYLVMALLASAVFARQRGGGVKILLALCAIAVVTVVVLGQQEHSTAIFNRIATLSDVEADQSTNIRVDIANRGFKTVLQNPLGFGFGSGGSSSKLGNVEQDAVSDNGYLDILSTLGVPGTLLYGIGLFLVVRLAVVNRRMATAGEATTSFGLGLLLAMVPALVIGNCLTSAHASYVWIILSRHLAANRPAATAGRPAARPTAPLGASPVPA